MRGISGGMKGSCTGLGGGHRALKVLSIAESPTSDGWMLRGKLDLHKEMHSEPCSVMGSADVWDHISMLGPVPATLPFQLSANAMGKVAHGGSRIWVPTPIWETQIKFWVPGFVLTYL